MPRRQSLDAVVVSVLATWLVGLVLFTILGGVATQFIGENAVTQSFREYLDGVPVVFLLLVFHTALLAGLLLLLRWLAGRMHWLTPRWLLWEYLIALGGMLLLELHERYYRLSWQDAAHLLPLFLAGALALGAGQWVALRTLPKPVVPPSPEETTSRMRQ